MALDSTKLIAPSLQMLFRDKTSGAPLRDGTVKFFKDSARNEAKSVFALSGTPPNYTYTDLGNEINLTGIGSFSDNDNNDIVPYYYPYSEDNENEVELYFVQVYDKDGIFQFSRAAWPNFITSSDASLDIVNYVPNGQFLIHNDLNADDTNNYVEGEIRAPITQIAQGGWTFERTANSTAKDVVTFRRADSAVTIPSGNPRYHCRIQTLIIDAADDSKDLRLKFRDVNKFSSDTDEFTYAFSAKNLAGGSNTIELLLIKDFSQASGGEGQEIIPLTTFTVTGSEQVFKYSFVFESNIDKVLGSANDDFLQLVIRLPRNVLNDLIFSDVILTPGDVTISQFPYTPDAEMIYKSLAGWMPIPKFDGMDLYLVPRLTPSGFIFDDSEIGNIEHETQLSEYTDSLHHTSNKLLANGAQYKAADYSPLRIPYRRLFQKYYDSTLQLPIYGTGDDYMTAYLADLTPASSLRIPANKTGVQTDATDGTAATGFTFSTIHAGSDYQKKAYIASADGDLVYVQGTEVASVTAPAAETSGFTIVSLRNSATEYELFSILTIAATTLAGKHFHFSSDTDDYLMWFTVDGAGAEPVSARTKIKVDLLSTFTAKEVAACVREAISGFQITTVVCGAASTLTAGDFFNIFADGVHYYVWYTIDGAGTEPVVANAIGIKVELLAADTAAQVASKTQAAINVVYFAVPYCPGSFLRGLDEEGVVDLDAARRFSNVSVYYGGKVGTREWDANLLHAHTATSTGTVALGFEGNACVAGAENNVPTTGPTALSIATTVHPTGGIGNTTGAPSANAYESRGFNTAVRMAIRY